MEESSCRSQDIASETNVRSKVFLRAYRHFRLFLHLLGRLADMLACMIDNALRAELLQI